MSTLGSILRDAEQKLDQMLKERQMLNDMKEIVGARIGTIITNNRKTIIVAFKAGRVTEFLDRKRMKFMADMDLGRNWELMANGPTLFFLDKEGKPYPANSNKIKKQ